MDGSRSNEIILYHTDFDKDLRFRNKQEELTHVYTVNYYTRIVELETAEARREPDVL